MKEYNFICNVPSKSNPRKTYTIKVDENGLFSCNCPSWIFNQRGNRTCKHIDALRLDGLTLDGKGRLITIIDKDKYGWETKVPKLCVNYPEQCNTCKMRFICWSQREAEFTREQVGV
jgi:hypothetical protein